MAKTKRYFISDVHLGVGSQWDWYQQAKHEKFLVGALDQIATEGATGTVKDVVLLGDLFDTWMAPIDTVPPSTGEIIKKHPNAVAALRRCLSKVDNIFYVNGNHDMSTTQKDLDAITSDGTDGAPAGNKKVKLIPRYHAGLLYAEHGSRFAMFNAPDRMHDPTDGLPLGYFVTRLLAGRSDYTNPATLAKSVDNLLEAAFTTQTIATSLIEALMELTKREPWDKIVMPGPRRSITISEVQKRYAPLYDRWVEKFGFRYANNAIRGEMNSLGWFADRLCDREGYKVVVFGHTHEAMQDGDGFFKTNRAYVNSGYFCSETPTFVEVDKLDGRFEVRIHEGKGEAVFGVKGKTRTVEVA